MKFILLVIATLLALKSNAALIQFHHDVQVADASSVWAIGSAQRTGSRFTLTDDHVFDAVSTWISSMDSREGISLDLDLVIYSADASGLLPDTKLYSQTFNPGADAELGWYGVSGVNWSLDAGTYFLALEAELGLSSPYGYVYQAPVLLDWDAPGIAWNVGWGDFAYGSSWGHEMALLFSTATAGKTTSVSEPTSFVLLLPFLVMLVRRKVTAFKS